MSEPKRGEHDETCKIMHPACLCTTCQRDLVFVHCKYGCEYSPCIISDCNYYLADEPTKKGADHE